MIRFILTLFILFFAVTNFAQKYVQVWGDEFNTPGLPDSTKWGYEVGFIRNNELQYYTLKRVENARVKDSVLIIEARKEQFKDAGYTSASIISKGIGDWEYGKIEIRAKVPTGKGTWPALWMLPTYYEYGGWPNSGEIDIMEYIGVEPQNLFYTAHFKGTKSDDTKHGSNGSGPINKIKDPFNQFIVFTLMWTPEKLEWFANGVKYHEYKKPSNDWHLWPFNKKFYLIMNLAYGGSWGGYDGVDDTKLPHKFIIDYVRVYQLQETAGPFSLTVQPVDGGTINISPKLDLYPENTEVTITAIPDSGYLFQSWKHTSGANPYTFNIRKNTVITPSIKKKSELITNGNFDYNYQPWQFYVNSNQNTSYTANTEDGRLVIDVKKSPGVNWKLGFQELAIPLKKGKYKLKFDASATQQKSLFISISKNYPDWGTFVSKNVTVTTTNKTYEIIFNMPANDNNTRLFFGIGNFTGIFTIDNISFSRVDESTSISEYIQQNNQPEIEIYPNPGNGVFTLKFINGKPEINSKLKIVNLNGKHIYEQNIPDRENRIELNAPAGIYLIKLISGINSITKKVVIN